MTGAAGRIPATIVTGFLGAGKTTLIRHLIQNAGGRRFAFVINEFGDLGVDREVIAGCGYEDCKDEDIVELANGCICCTVADDFLPTIQALLDRADPPDHIIIETSGLALPKPLIKAFAWPEVKTRVTVDGVVAVIDGRALADGRFADDPEALAAQRAADPGLDHENPLEEVFEEQVLAADMIVLNKTDLVEAATLSAARSAVGALVRPGAGMLEAAHGKVVGHATDVTDPATLAAEVDDQARRLTAEVGADGRRVTHVAVKLRTASFWTRTKIAKLPDGPTGDADVVAAKAVEVLHRFDLDRPIRLVGVRVVLADPA